LKKGFIIAFRNPERIVIEIVESQQLESTPVVETFIRTLKEKGCKISIDDFGTGYSNFEYLLRLNADIYPTNLKRLAVGSESCH